MGVPRRIPLRTVTTIVRFAIDLDSQPHGQTGEIDHVVILGTLLAESEPTRPPAELLPEENFRQAHLPAETARMLHRFRGCSNGPVPSTRHILPGTGRGTIRRSRMVVGSIGGHRPIDPSVSAPRCHLPVPGRIFACVASVITSETGRSARARGWGR
jgi:hypothetical protein